jgi:hypothetical protein
VKTIASGASRFDRQHAVLALLWTIATACNLFKPYHIDDAAYLAIARWICVAPLHPMQGILNWSGIDEPIASTNQPHLYFYLLALWGSLVGFREPAMHALQSLFALAAIATFFSVARVLVPIHALWLTAMLALSPGFIVGQNLMVDVPLLALWLLFFRALLLDAEAGAPRQRRRFLTAATAVSAALLVKYSSLILLPILALVVAQKRYRRYAWVMSLPLGVLVTWSLFNLYDYGAIHIAQRPIGGVQASYPQLRQFTALLITAGAITPLGVIVLVRGIPALRRVAPAIYAAATIAFGAVAAGVAAGRLDEDLVDIALRIGFVLNAMLMALAVCAALVAPAWRRRALGLFEPDNQPRLILALWIACHLVFYGLFAPFMAVRHLLLALPAVLLLSAMLWPRLSRADVTFGLTVSLALSLALAVSDYRFAAFFRDEPARVRGVVPADATVWFTGHWGWQYYASQAGFHSVDVERPRLRPGDFLVAPQDITREPIRNPPPLTLIRVDRKALGLGDLFCTGQGARFYSTVFLESPWRITRSCTNVVHVYRVDGTE